MENLNEISKASRESSVKDLNGSRGSIKSTRSLEQRTSHTLSNSGSIKSDKDVHFAKSSSIKSRSSDVSEKQVDASLKVPHKIIANWRHACDKTRDRTRDLLKRWRTLPEFEGAQNGPSKTAEEDGNKSAQTESGWSVHVWSKTFPQIQHNINYIIVFLLATWVDRFSMDMEAWDEEGGYQLTSTQNAKFSHFFTHLLDHDHDDLICEQDFEVLIEVNGANLDVMLSMLNVLCMHASLDCIEVSTFR